MALKTKHDDDCAHLKYPPTGCTCGYAALLRIRATLSDMSPEAREELRVAARAARERLRRDPSFIEDVAENAGRLRDIFKGKK